MRCFPRRGLADGKSIATVVSYAEARGGTRLRGSTDIWILPVDRQTPASPWFETADREWAPVISPNGGLLAYVSDESGRSEVYVRPYPGPGGKIQISNNGGTEPAWSRDGRELVYREADRFMSVDVGSAPRITVTRRVCCSRGHSCVARARISRVSTTCRETATSLSRCDPFRANQSRGILP